MGRKKKEINLKEPVRIREKELADGNKSLYLDMYYKGERKKETLKLYLVPEVNATTKLQNANTRKLAEQIKAQRILDIQETGLVDWEKVKRQRITLPDWTDECINDKASLSLTSVRTKRNARARVAEYLDSIRKKDLALADVDKDFCKGFIVFLSTCKFNKGKKTLSCTTSRVFVNYTSSMIDKGVRDSIISRNPFKLLDQKEKPQKKHATKEYLDIAEFKKIMAVPCRYDIVKKAFLFSCFTGLRYSDILALKWSEIHTAADGKTLYIEHTQVKTKNEVTIPLSKEALKWMPERRKGKERVFHEIGITSTIVEVVLGEWMKEAGINKHITYHVARHTAATLAITAGAELYTVSKILGHSSIASTQVYAKVNMEKKVEAVNLFDGAFE